MRTETIVLCRPGNKWTTGLISSTPDPCPSGQKMTAESISFAQQSDLQFDQSTFNSSENAAAYAFAFSSVLFVYMTAKGVGAIINFWKKN